jgi:hypothetical protein
LVERGRGPINLISDRGDAGEKPSDGLARETAGDEDQARAVVVVRPILELDRWVGDVLDDVDNHRPAALGDAPIPLMTAENIFCVPEKRPLRAQNALFISRLGVLCRALWQPNFAGTNAHWQPNGSGIQRPASLSRNSY